MDEFFFYCLYLQSCALLCPNQIALSIALASFGKDVALNMPLFFHAFWYVPALLKWGKVAHSIICLFLSKDLYAYSPIIYIYVETMNVSQLDA